MAELTNQEKEMINRIIERELGPPASKQEADEAPEKKPEPGSDQAIINEIVKRNL